MDRANFPHKPLLIERFDLIENNDGIGYARSYEIFAGNTHDSKTVETMINTIEKLYGKADRIWIMDRGMLSPENLQFLRQEQRRYISGTPKSQLKHFETELQQAEKC